MSLEGAIVRARARTEALQLRDTCTARRKDGLPVYDDETGNTVQPYEDLYAGPCRMRQPRASAGAATAGEADVLLQSPEIHLPMSADLLKPGDEITITASASDAASVGRIFRVRAVPAHANATARRYGVIERTG
jgi:hypothetical protein